MEDILKYENRNRLYEKVAYDLGLVKVDEKYDTKMFGNWYVVLEAPLFFISYINDRSFLDVSIRSKLDSTHHIALSFVKELIYDPENMNSAPPTDNETRIKNMNDFLRTDFTKICDLFSPEKYRETEQRIDDLLRKAYYKKRGK